LAQVRQVFGSYRKDDFADADTFIANALKLMERYPDSAIEEVCDPRSGIVTECKFPPTIAELKQACDYHAERQARIAELACSTFKPREPRPPLPPGGAANLLVRRSHPDYDKYIAWSQAPERDDREWKWDEDERGIWVGLNAQADIRKHATADTWKRYTDDELRAIYAPKPAEPQP